MVKRILSYLYRRKLVAVAIVDGTNVHRAASQSGELANSMASDAA